MTEQPRNDILTALDPDTGKHAAYLYSYELTPSESVRPILRVSSEPVFDSAEHAIRYLWSFLTPDVKAYTKQPECVREQS